MDLRLRPSYARMLKAYKKVISMIQSIDEPLMKHCIFTTGTVLISRSALSKADVLPGCFVEPVFNSERPGGRSLGRQVFISWKHKKGGSGLPGSRLRQENLWQK